MQPIDEQGFVIVAVNSLQTDYVGCAERLAASIRRWHTGARICLLTDQTVDNPMFDHVRLLGGSPNQSVWSRDSQIWRMTPFRETIKLEADMLIVSDIQHWWTMFRHRDVVVSTGCRDYYDQPSRSRYYRRLFDDNHLPDVYNAITYWRRSETAMHFFQWVRKIFSQWAEFRHLLKHSPDCPDTDLVYAMAAQIVGPEFVTLPFSSYPKIVHMKQHIIGTHGPHWHKELVWEYDQSSLRINTVAQWGAFHYHHKDWQP